MKEFQYQHRGLSRLEYIRLTYAVHQSLESMITQKPTTIKIRGTPVRSLGIILQYEQGIVAFIHANYIGHRQIARYEQEIVPYGFLSVKVFPFGENDLISRVEEDVKQFGLVAVESKGDLYI